MLPFVFEYEPIAKDYVDFSKSVHIFGLEGCVLYAVILQRGQTVLFYSQALQDALFNASLYENAVVQTWIVCESGYVLKFDTGDLFHGFCNDEFKI